MIYIYIYHITNSVFCCLKVGDQQSMGSQAFGSKPCDAMGHGHREQVGIFTKNLGAKATKTSKM